MNKELKIVSINNIKFDTPLSSKEAFKKYREIRNKEWIDELKNILLRANPPPDLIEDRPVLRTRVFETSVLKDGAAIGAIKFDIGSGINIKKTKED